MQTVGQEKGRELKANTVTTMTPHKVSKRIAIRVAISAILMFAASALLAAEEGAGDYEGRLVDEMKVVGAKHTKEYIITRELASKPGEPLLEKNLKEDRANLDALGVFSVIKVYPVEENERLVLTVEVKETFRYLPTVSLKISDENGISIGGGLKSTNLFGRAMFLSGTAFFGGATTVVLWVKDNWVVGDHIGYDLKYFHMDRRNELYEFNEVSDEVSLVVLGRLGRRGRLGMLSSFQSLRSDTDGKTLDPSNRDNILSAGLIVGYDSRDFKSNPHSGWYTSADLSRVWSLDAGTAHWSGNIDLWRFIQLSGPHILGLFSLTTLTSGRVGVEIAEWQQYSLGGTSSVRGWDIGRRYGKNQFINTLEYRYNVLEPRNFEYFGVNASLGIQVAAFGDAGAVWTGRERFRDSWIVGGGVGLRLIIPYVGLARLDLGWGDSSTGVLLHVGALEKAEKARMRVR
jgi:outer membrane protein assembly factor BamA